MRPKDLKPPFRWNERQVVAQDGVLYVPERCHSYGEWVFPSVGKPVHVEFCSGNGDWVVERARQNPDQFWIAVEKRFDRVRKIWSKMRNAELQNLLIICGEAQLVTSHYFPSDAISAVYINFPDPWPKARHAKHRITQPTFIDQIRRILSSDGSFTFVTDDEPYAADFLAQMEGEEGFVQQLESNELPGYGGSWFEQLWRGKGKRITYIRYAKELACAV